MEGLEAELARARELDVNAIADAIESIGFECTRCGGCCTADEAEGGTTEDGPLEPHTATVFPDEIRRLQSDGDYDFRDVARPMPYGLTEGADGLEGETFEWALQTDDCGNCTFYTEDVDGVGTCTVHEERPLICQTYPFSVALGGTSQPMGGVVEQKGTVRAHECEGLGREIARDDAEELAETLKERAIRELEEAIAVRERYVPLDSDDVVVYDSEGPKRIDGTAYETGDRASGS
ncbi:YkgJ family cysteine cluster protein [Halapricum hydrolyticum]|uniref:YkgJ family cysteine cluster protein n=1 Tax=Halapricum hydrolyticum TaxID=2979991 RepID=A0AAE3LEH0_9EURY|nr:YkgJ family cysteine cluster protein [Halapricum hydrolyticum]MCU4717073.1 YkgJ family cysteine cluster protein [Halapricum hydrolyticum]MCU4726000.1 YkgJ family cysteine cluster protein [Halapricum hydrolyticum]